MEKIAKFTKDLLTVNVYSTAEEMGAAAASDVAARIAALLSEKAEINMIFAAAPSQNTFLAHLVADKRIEWNRINAYHMDEYIGIASDAPQGFANFLRRSLFDLVPFKSVNTLDCTAKDAEAECERYSALLNDNPVDIVCLGIGENAHIAFNDPWVADFNDPKTVKCVPLDDVCRQQQVNDGCFATMDDVPKTAMSVTIPGLTRAPWMFCIVPYKTKAQAVYNVIHKEISEQYPATVLRKKENSILYLNSESAALL